MLFKHLLFATTTPLVFLPCVLVTTLLVVITYLLKLQGNWTTKQQKKVTSPAYASGFTNVSIHSCMCQISHVNTFHNKSVPSTSTTQQTY